MPQPPTTASPWAAALAAFLDAVETCRDVQLQGLIVSREGRTAAEAYWQPYEPGDHKLVYSVSKTFTALAVGFALAEGRFRVSDRLGDLFPDVPQHPWLTELTVHHLLSMSTGHVEDTWPSLFGTPPAEWAARLLAVPPASPVGSRHVYNNGASWLLGELVRRCTGETLLSYLRARLFVPLGLTATWDADALGREFGLTGLHVPLRGLAAVGELLRRDGIWRGRRVLPPGWVEQVSQCHVPTAEDNPDWSLGYGYQVWMGREGYRLDGAFGQFAFVLPERGAVIAIMSNQPCTQRLVDLLWAHVVSHLESATAAEPPRPLRLPTPADRLGDHAGRLAASRWWQAEGPARHDASLAGWPTPPEPVDTMAPLEAPSDLSLAASAAGWELAFAQGARTYQVTPPSGAGWHRARLLRDDGSVIPAAIGVAATPDGAALVDLVVTDSPHVLHLRLSDGVASWAWNGVPLQGGDLGGLRAR